MAKRIMRIVVVAECSDPDDHTDLEDVGEIFKDWLNAGLKRHSEEHGDWPLLIRVRPQSEHYD